MGKHLLIVGAVALVLCFVAGIFVSQTGFDLTPPPDPAAQTDVQAPHEALLEGPESPSEAEIAEINPEMVEDAEPFDPQRGVPGVPPDVDFDLDEAILEGNRYVVPLEGGLRMVLTLNPDVQEHMKAIYRKYDVPHAAFVAVEPATGRVLALVGQEGAADPVGDVERKAMAPSASVFKIITAAALIEDKGIGIKDKVCVPEGKSLPSEDDIQGFGNPDTVCMDLATAFGKSNNYVFTRLAHRHLSADGLRQWSARFGYNEPIPFNLPTEASTTSIPDDPVARAKVAAGFWHTHLTPLHGALISAAIANGGIMMRPNMIEEIIDENGDTLYQFEPVPYRKVIEPATARALAEMMVYTTTVGTASGTMRDPKTLSPDFIPAGKTGTLSQNKPYLMFSWFVGFAPVDDPQVAVSALLCNPARWRIKSSWAAAQALRIFSRPIIAARAPDPAPEEDKPAGP